MSDTNFVTRYKCPICQSEQLRTLYQIPFDEPPIKDYLVNFYSSPGKVEFEYLEGATYHLCECEECSLVFQREIPDSNLLQRLYETWITTRKEPPKNQETLEYSSYIAQEIMRIAAFFDKVPPSISTFDFGMGWGKWALMAKAFGCESYGAELSEKRIEYARSSGITIVSWDEIPQHQFDFINTEQVFEHLAEPLETLCHLRKALKPSGILKISVPTANDIKRRLRIEDWNAPKGTINSLNPVAPLEHINCFNRKSLLNLAEKSDLKEISIPIKLHYIYTTNWIGARRIARNILQPITRNILKRRNYMFFGKI